MERPLRARGMERNQIEAQTQTQAFSIFQHTEASAHTNRIVSMCNVHDWTPYGVWNEGPSTRRSHVLRTCAHCLHSNRSVFVVPLASFSFRIENKSQPCDSFAFVVLRPFASYKFKYLLGKRSTTATPTYRTASFHCTLHTYCLFVSIFFFFFLLRSCAMANAENMQNFHELRNTNNP